MPCLYTLIPVLGEKISPLPGWLDKLQHIMLKSYPLCSGYLLQLSIKFGIIFLVELGESVIPTGKCNLSFCELVTVINLVTYVGSRKDRITNMLQI